MLSDKVYQFLKNLVQLILPGFATLYLSLAELWNLPNGLQVAGTTAALATFLGVVLRMSTKSYNASDAAFDGSMVVSTTEDGGLVYSLELKGDPAELVGKNSVSFKVT